MSRRFQVRDGDTARLVDVHGDGEVSIDGARFRVEPVGHGRLRVIAADGRSELVSVAGPLAAPWVFARGLAAELEVASEGARPAKARAPAGAMTAPMPATVVSIAAPVGTRVAQGDAVVVLEAMKMELIVRAPHDGVVSAVHCHVGDLIRPGTLVAELGP
jgi:biotin carboxyl carrier protein